MKKLLVLVFMLAFVIASQAQTKVPEVTANGSINEASYVYLGGKTTDTLANVDTFTYILRVKGMQTMDIKAQIYLDHVSGTAGGKLKSYKSINGLTWVVTAPGDSITTASVTADVLDSEELTYADYMGPYIKFIYIQSGTAVTVPRIYIYAKPN